MKTLEGWVNSLEFKIQGIEARIKACENAISFLLGCSEIKGLKSSLDRVNVSSPSKISVIGGGKENDSPKVS